jgi:Uma2 family endonuclease
LVSIDEYMDTAYSPDREFVDGVIMERHLGEFPHSVIQSNLIFFLRSRCPKLFVLPEQRIRTRSNRTRIPDVCVAENRPADAVFETPPLICIEILSRRDEMTDVLEKLDEYSEFGVQEIWLIDPRRKKAFRYAGGLAEVSVFRFTSDVATFELSLDDVFYSL